MTGASRRSTRVASPSAALVVAILVAVACGGSGPTASRPAGASAAGSSPASAELTPVPGGAGTSGAPSGTPTQTDTAWGRIWDAVPDSFPRPASARPADSISGPVSTAFSVGAGPAEVVATMKAGLGAAGYATDVSGPLEDGGYVLDSTGSAADCRVQTTITPLSGTTLMTVLFGAGCPFE